MLTDERIKLIWESMPYPTFTCQGFARLIEAEVLQAQEPAGYANGYELDNMLDDRSITIAARPNGFQRTPIFTTPQPPSPCQCAELRSEVERLTQKNADLREKLHDESAQHVQFMLHDHPKALAARDATIAQQAERIAEFEKVAQAYEDQVAAHNKTLDELKYTGLAAEAEAKRGDELQSKVAEQAALIEKCEKALVYAVELGALMREAPTPSRPYWFDKATIALAAEVRRLQSEVERLPARRAQPAVKTAPIAPTNWQFWMNGTDEEFAERAGRKIDEVTE